MVREEEEISTESNVSGWECAKDHEKILHQH